ncbi:hypothetical protein [Kitasatospora sp. NPDC092286]|uniref:hypothetical protein n=1 Tax=Kitasatospora sp. NPDC092286 TaxID=3364087 RepID=UPI0037F412D7
MNSTHSRNKARTAALAAAAGLVPVGVGRGLGWPVWVWVVAAAVIALLVTQLTVRGPEGEGVVPSPPPYPSAVVPPEAPAELPYQEARVEGVALPSGVPDYDFVFSATVWWRPLHNRSGLVHANPGSLAVETVLARARAVTEYEHPARLDLVRHRLDGVLGTQSPDASGLVVAMAGRVGLGLPEADRDRLGKLSEVRKAEEVWEHERRYERNKRAYLGDDVLKSPGSAVVWWLARNDEEVTRAVDLIGPLAQLSAVANNQAVDELYEHLVARPVRQPVPFLDGAAPGAGAALHHPDVDGGGRRGPSVVGPLNDLMDDVKLKEEDGERTVYAHRVALFTEAIGRPEEAALIRASLGDPGDGPAGGAAGGAAEPEQPGPEPGTGSGSGAGSWTGSWFVPGPVRPAAEDVGGEEEQRPAAWEVFTRDSADGTSPGAGRADPAGRAERGGEG